MSNAPIILFYLLTIYTGSYPHVFNNRETLPFECQGVLWEYPILHLVTYPNGGAGLDRAIFTFEGADEGDIMLVPTGLIIALFTDSLLTT